MNIYTFVRLNRINLPFVGEKITHITGTIQNISFISLFNIANPYSSNMHRQSEGGPISSVLAHRDLKAYYKTWSGLKVSLVLTLVPNNVLAWPQISIFNNVRPQILFSK